MIDRHLRPSIADGLTRRRFLAAVAASGALAACSGGSDDALGTELSADPGAAGDGFTLVQRFPNNVLIPGEVRMPITLSTGAAQFIQDGPKTLTAQVIDFDGNQLGGAISAVRRDVAPAPYYDFRTTVDEPGFYALVVPGGPDDGAPFQIMDPQAVAVPYAGQALEPFDTPTVDDPQGFDLLCTRAAGQCPFHDVTLTEALAGDRPVAYYVGTPAFCATGSCAPALEALIDLQDRFGDAFTFVHAEVYSDDTGTTVAPAVTAVGMTYEPALFITDADGTIVERMDAVWDQSELAERLALYV